MRKLKVLFHSDMPLANTGFAKHARNILSYLYKTGKYELITYNCGMPLNHPDLQRLPWKSYGTLPNSQQELNQILSQHPPEQREFHIRQISYGAMNIDNIIALEKPDVYIGVQDIWGVDYCVQRNWFDKIHSVIWTTLDSLPLLKSAVEIAPKIKNYWVWSEFAEKEMHRLGHTHVKTVPGAVDTKNFHRLEAVKKENLRKKNNIDTNAFVIGFVARNQLRKQFPQIIEGFSIFKKKNPLANTKLLFHTNWAEPGGWDLHMFADMFSVNKKDILTTYICKSCKDYHIRDFIGHDINCPRCNTEKSCVTTGVQFGVSEQQLNEINNLMDVATHAISSGGLELPIIELKCSEVITCVTNYSCGEDMCIEEAGSFPLDYVPYYEHGTNFKKSTTKAHSIAQQIQKVFELSDLKKREITQKAREWAIKKFSIESVGKRLEKFLDELKPLEYKVEPIKSKQTNPQASIEDILSSDVKTFVNECYQRFLSVKPDIEGGKYWESFLSNSQEPQEVLRNKMADYFKQVAIKDSTPQQVSLDHFLDKDDDGKRILFIIPEGIGDIFLCTSLFKSLKEQYSWANLYVSCREEFASILEGNPYVHKYIPYNNSLDNQLYLEGIGDHKGFFELSFHPYFSTQRMLDYVNNGKTKIALKLQD